MCGRYTLTTTTSFKKRFGLLDKPPKFDVSYNISPSTYNPVIIRNSPNQVVMMKWGFVPEWSKDKKFSLINIRKETLEEKPYFKKIFQTNRCLIPADGFYEWKRINLEGREEKIPYYIHLNENKVFSFAGLYSKLTDAEGMPIYTYAIITCPPNKAILEVHNRMPVILDEKYEDSWLNSDNNLEETKNLMKPFSEELKPYPVGRDVNRSANDNFKLIEPVSFPV